MKFIKPFIYSVSIITLSLLSACSEKTESAQVDTPYYHVAKIIQLKEESFYTVNRAYTGQISTRQVSKLGFEFSGIVNQVFVDNGDRIIQGQILAQQSIELLTIKAKELTSQIKQNQAQIALNKINLKRVTKLESKGFSSQQQLDELKTEKKVLLASLQGLKASFSAIKYQISHSKLIAPFDGIIDKRVMAKGEVISAGAPVFQLIKQGQKQITVGVPAKLAASLTLGKVFDVAIAEQHAPAKLIAIGDQVSLKNRTVELRLGLPANIASFNGQIAKITIPEKIKQIGTWLPITALTDGIRGQWNIFTVKPQANNLYQINTMTVQVLYTNQEQAFVTIAGDKFPQIIAEGVHRYVSGQHIRKATTLISKNQPSQGAQL